jgi:hypothetical protein
VRSARARGLDYLMVRGVALRSSLVYDE